MTDTKPSTRIVELPTQWLRDHMPEALTIYGLAMGYDSAVVADSNHGCDVEVELGSTLTQGT